MNRPPVPPPEVLVERLPMLTDSFSSSVTLPVAPLDVGLRTTGPLPSPEPGLTVTLPLPICRPPLNVLELPESTRKPWAALSSVPAPDRLPASVSVADDPVGSTRFVPEASTTSPRNVDVWPLVRLTIALDDCVAESTSCWPTAPNVSEPANRRAAAPDTPIEPEVARFEAAATDTMPSVIVVPPE